MCEYSPASAGLCLVSSQKKISRKKLNLTGHKVYIIICLAFIAALTRWDRLTGHPNGTALDELIWGEEWGGLKRSRRAAPQFPREQIMDYLRIWTEADIDEIKEHIVIVDDSFGHCPNCKKIGIPLKELTKCPECGREFRFVTSKEAQGGKHDIVMRTRKKLPAMKFVDYNDYERVTGKKGAESLFKI